MVALTNYKGNAGKSWGWGQWQGNRDENMEHAPQSGILYRNNYIAPIKIGQITDGTSNTFLIGEDVPAYNPHTVAYFANGSFLMTDAPMNYMPELPTFEDIRGLWYDLFGFRSRHAGGAHFAMADGSVGFYDEGMDYKLYQALSTKAGDETLNQGS